MHIKSNRQLRFVQLSASLGFVVVLLDVSVVNVALKALHAKFDTDITDLQWVINAYALVFAALLLSAGALGDRLGVKRVFLSGLGIFTLASGCCGLAPSLSALILARIVQGLGAALLVPASLSLLRQVFVDTEARNRAVGWWGAAGGVALAAGPVIGGLLISLFGWRSIFLINLPIGLSAIVMVSCCAPASKVQSTKSLDLPGQISGALALASLTIALTEVSHLGWGNPVIIFWDAVFVVFTALFLWLEARNPEAMLPLNLFSSPTLSSATLIGMISNLAFYGIVFIFSLYFQLIMHFTPLQTGIAFSPMTGVLVMGNIAASRLLSRTGVRQLTVLGLLMATAGYLLLLSGLALSSYSLMIVPMLIAGGGMALVTPTITNATLAAVPMSQAGIASGLLNAARQTGGVIGVAIFGFLVRHQERELFITGVQHAVILAAAALLLATVLAVLYLRQQHNVD